MINLEKTKLINELIINPELAEPKLNLKKKQQLTNEKPKLK